MFKTKLTDMLGIRYPIVQGGMGPWVTNEVAKAVSNAGGLGIVTLASLVVGDISVTMRHGSQEMIAMSPEERVHWAINSVKEATRANRGIFGVNTLVSMEIADKVGLGIKTVLEMREKDSELKERLQVVITSAGDPVPWASLIKPSGIKWFHVVPSVRHALRAEKAGVDAVIASGHEGGGHVAWEPVHSVVLTPAVVKAVRVPVISAGGYCDGSGLVAALALGACGIQMGTRFIATQESDFVEMWKEKILKCNERDTVYCRGFSGPLRHIRNRKAMELGDMTLKKTPRLYLGIPDEALDPEIYEFEKSGWDRIPEGDEEGSLIFGGEVVGRIDDIPTVAELVSRIGREAEETISSLAGIVESV